MGCGSSTNAHAISEPSKQRSASSGPPQKQTSHFDAYGDGAKLAKPTHATIGSDSPDKSSSPFRASDLTGVSDEGTPLKTVSPTSLGNNRSKLDSQSTDALVAEQSTQESKATAQFAPTVSGDAHTATENNENLHACATLDKASNDSERLSEAISTVTLHGHAYDNGLPSTVLIPETDEDGNTTRTHAESQAESNSSALNDVLPRGESALAEITTKRFAITYLHAIGIAKTKVLKKRPAFMRKPLYDGGNQIVVQGFPTGGLATLFQKKEKQGDNMTSQRQIHGIFMWIELTSEDVLIDEEKNKCSNEEGDAAAQAVVVHENTDKTHSIVSRAFDLQGDYIKEFSDKPPRLRPLLRKARMIQERAQEMELKQLNEDGMGMHA
jgi:hypothetical protein